MNEFLKIDSKSVIQEAKNIKNAPTTKHTVQQICPSRPSFLENSPAKDYLDFSTEEKGFFTKKDAKGNVIEIIRLIYPR